MSITIPVFWLKKTKAEEDLLISHKSTQLVNWRAQNFNSGLSGSQAQTLSAVLMDLLLSE